MPNSSRIFRFAPSPNGLLHLGHARSALLGFDLARAVDGQFLIRIEDIDTTRCSRVYEAAILNDLNRLGIRSDAPVRQQSRHFPDYVAALSRLKEMDLVYPTFLSRSAIRRRIEAFEASTGQIWPRDPDGAALYPGDERELSPEAVVARISAGGQVIWRLNMSRALARTGALTWQESGGEDSDPALDALVLAGRRMMRTIMVDPTRWGDVILARADVPTSYHLSVVVDDAMQGVTDVVRGADLYQATSVHRILQELLGFPAPTYHHHALVLDGSGRKLSKSDGDSGLSALLDQGLTPYEIRRLVGM